MVLVFVVIQCYFIDQSFKSNKLNFLSFSLYLATICESIIASIISTLPFNSGWDFNLRTCGVKSFADWYTLFFNPSINENFHCTQEAVYPLYSIVFIFYFIALCLVLSRHIYLRLICFILYFITRSNQVKRLYPKDCITKNTYYILYSIPALLFIHAILAGVICKYKISKSINSIYNIYFCRLYISIPYFIWLCHIDHNSSFTIYRPKFTSIDAINLSISQLFNRSFSLVVACIRCNFVVQSVQYCLFILNLCSSITHFILYFNNQIHRPVKYLRIFGSKIDHSNLTNICTFE